MTTDELREAFLDFFASKGCVRKPSDVLVPNDPTVLVHAGRDEPVQARVHGPGRPEVQARHDLPEVHPHRRHRERRQDAAPHDVLRDARQLQLRRLLQARGDPLGLGVPHQDAQGSRRPADVHGLPRRRRGVQHLAQGGRRSGRPDHADGRGRQLLARRALRRTVPTASAARAPRSSTTATASRRSRSGTSSSPSSTASVPVSSNRCRTRTSTPAWAWNAWPPRLQKVRSNFEIDIFQPIVAAAADALGDCLRRRQPRRHPHPPHRRPRRRPDVHASTRTSGLPTRSRATSSAACSAAPCSTPTRWAGASRSCTSSCRSSPR